jgi:arylsulfatase A-like enzyme
MRKLVKGKLGDADVDELLRLYDTEIAATDRAVGRLVDHVRRKLGRDDAVVVVTADHGEEFLDHGRWGHTTRLYEELLRVPLIIHYPDHRAGRESTPVSLVDVAPTVLAAAGLPVPDEAEGVDLGAGAPPRAIFAETASDTRRAAIVSGDLKAIWDRKSQGYELYDLAADPLEKTELSATRPDDLARLSTALQAWTQRIKAERLPTEKTKTSDEERSMLQELGYVAD